MRKIRHIIWSSNIDINDWIDAYKEENEPQELFNGDDVYNWAYEINNDYLRDERYNLNKKIDNTIIAIADIGRWDGRYKGYKVIGHNIADCLYTNDDDAEWYVDGKDFKCTTYNHDGGNYIIYRKVKREADVEKVLNKIYNNEFTHDDMIKYTTSLKKDISEVYGW